MEKKDTISIISVVIALLAFAVPQWLTYQQERAREYRIETKLKLFYLCQNTFMTEQQMIDAVQKQQPGGSADGPEIRRAIYEMVAEEVLVFNIEKKAYQVSSFSLIGKPASP